MTTTRACPRERHNVARAIPVEPDVPSTTVERLSARARELGLWNLCVRNPDFGPGLSFVDYAPLAEMMGPHRLAQEATNCDPPSNINADAMIIHGNEFHFYFQYREH